MSRQPSKQIIDRQAGIRRNFQAQKVLVDRMRPYENAKDQWASAGKENMRSANGGTEARRVSDFAPFWAAIFYGGPCQFLHDFNLCFGQYHETAGLLDHI
jgi:hypothetical protein